MSVTLQQFIGAWSGKMIPSRGGITGQCVSMVQHWAEDQGVTGTPVFPVPAAKDMPGKRPDFFTWVANTPTGVPSPGDIIVWGTGVGQWGHTAIFIDGNATSFRSFDQNWPTGSAAHVQAHNYNGVLGWLKLKQPTQGVTTMDTNAGRELYRTGLFREPENDGSGSAGQWNGQSPAQALAALRTSPEWQADAKKVRDYDALAVQVQQLASNPTKDQLAAITNQLKASSDQVAELQQKVADAQAKLEANPDTQLLNESGGWISKLIKRLLGGK